MLNWGKKSFLSNVFVLPLCTIEGALLCVCQRSRRYRNYIVARETANAPALAKFPVNRIVRARLFLSARNDIYHSYARQSIYVLLFKKK